MYIYIYIYIYFRSNGKVLVGLPLQWYADDEDLCGH